MSENWSGATFWLIFSSSLIGFGYMIISKILENRKKDDEEDENKEENVEEQKEDTE